MWCGCMLRHPHRERQMSLQVLLLRPSHSTALPCPIIQMMTVPVGLQVCGVGSHDVALALRERERKFNLSIQPALAHEDVSMLESSDDDYWGICGFRVDWKPILTYATFWL